MTKKFQTEVEKSNMCAKKRLLQVVGLLLTILLLTACGESAPFAATNLPPTSSPPTGTAADLAGSGVITPVSTSAAWQTADAGRIQFQPNSTRWSTDGDLASDSAVRYVLSAREGQQMTVWLVTEPASTDVPVATLFISDANGQVLSPNSTMYWSSVLLASQDYSVEVRSLSDQQVAYSLRVEIPALSIDPSIGEKYEPVSASVCQMIQETAAQALAVDFRLEPTAPFLDNIAREAGQGCRLVATGDGNDFTSPYSALDALLGSAGLGWTEQPAYQADGPTGTATALARDQALMLISAKWLPAEGVLCPEDQPISACNLTPEQKIYTIHIDIAQYRADFSLDGHWEDSVSGFSLDLYQEWKNIYGRHLMVAQAGSKIDSLDVSINGSLHGQVADVEFQSSFTDDIGTAQITYMDVDTITWKIITPPGGEYYLPAQATLTRK